jgi:hypothetical protein
MAVTAA